MKLKLSRTSIEQRHINRLQENPDITIVFHTPQIFMSFSSELINIRGYLHSRRRMATQQRWPPHQPPTTETAAAAATAPSNTITRYIIRRNLLLHISIDNYNIPPQSSWIVLTTDSK